MNPNRSVGPAFPRRIVCKSFVLLAALAGLGCTGLNFLFGPELFPQEKTTDLDLGIAIVNPATPTTTTVGVQTIVQWADIATIPGTVVRISAQRENNLAEPIGDPIQLVGDGTPGSGRDAIGDGENDKFVWDIVGVRVGDYVITATIEAPDGTTKTALSRDPDRGTTGIFTITTALPVPTFAFTAPAADTTVTTGNTTNIAWNDNGNANADALLTLGLDPDDDRDNGNEIILVRDQLLSEGGNTGQFTFAFLDENGNGVPDGTYTVFAIVDDNANDIVRATAAGQLLLNP